MTSSSSRSDAAHLAQSERLHTLGQLVAGVIHEMNNPLTIVNANLQMLTEYIDQLQLLVQHYQASGLTNETIEAYQDEIDLPFLQQDLERLMSSCQEGAHRAMKLVGELRRYSASNSLVVGPVDLRASLQSTVRLVDSTFRHRVRFHLDIDQLPSVMGVAGHIQQVFMNLLINACQAIALDGEVRIEGRRDGDDAVITVSDTGAGISPEVLPRIFDPYFTTKSAAEGTGLGLPISKRIIEQHGGRLELNSVLGSGTTFVITLPIEGPEETMDPLSPYEL